MVFRPVIPPIIGPTRYPIASSGTMPWEPGSSARAEEPALQQAPRWYRGDLGVTLVFGKVSNWANQGTEGSANDYAQGTAGNRPTMGTLGGKPALVMSLAGTTYMESPSPAYSAAHCLMVLAIDNDPCLNPTATDAGIDRTGTGVEPSFCYQADGIIYDEFATSVRKTTVNPGPSCTTVRVYERFSGSGEWTNWLDGTQLFTTAVNTVAWRATKLQIGGSSVAGYYMNGKIAEYMIFPTKRTSAQHAALAAYFNARYGTACV